MSARLHDIHQFQNKKKQSNGPNVECHNSFSNNFKKESGDGENGEKDS